MSSMVSPHFSMLHGFFKILFPFITLLKGICQVSNWIMQKEVWAEFDYFMTLYFCFMNL